MNQYGTQMMALWSVHAPNQSAALTRPREFFTSLGDQIAAEIHQLAQTLVSRQMMGENYLDRVAEYNTARKLAEEVVMHQHTAWINAPVLAMEQTREDWEQNRVSDENLILWAERIQDSPDLMPSSAELEDKATSWALPVDFLETLLEAEIPRNYLNQHRDLLAQAATTRYHRNSH